MAEKTLERWQWVRGDDAGTVEEVKETTPEFKVFVSGRKCANDILYEFMVPLDQANQGYEFGNFGPNVGLDTPLNNGGANQSTPRINQQSQQHIKIHEPQESPIQKLLKKNKNKSSIDLETRVVVDIPTKGTFDVLLESFGEEVFEEILNDAISQIDVESIAMQLKESMKTKLKEVYNLKSE